MGTTSQHEIDDPIGRLPGSGRRRPGSRREQTHPHRQAVAGSRHREADLLFSYETENGIVVSESGVQKQIGAKADEAGTVSQGSYSFPEDGRRYTVNWVADENGFQAKGDHLPTPPPLPEHVVKLLQDLIAAGL